MPGLPVGKQPNTFADLTLDRAAEHRDDAEWLAAREADATARFMYLDADLRLAVDAKTDAPLWIDAGQRRRLFGSQPASLLGTRAEHTYFLLHDRDGAAPLTDTDAPSPTWQSLREAGMHLDPFHAGLFAYACGLAQWQTLTRYCRTCGTPLAYASAGHRAVCRNPDCAAMQFPRTDPAIIVIVEHDGACLLGRQASWPAGRYSTLAGFVEPGETLENAVRREVSEEAGVDVLECRYHSSQPWPFPASLMVGFTATARGRDITLRDGELEHARWFTPTDIVAGVEEGSLLPSSRVSVAWRLLADWMQLRAGIDLSRIRRP